MGRVADPLREEADRGNRSRTTAAAPPRPRDAIRAGTLGWASAAGNRAVQRLAGRGGSGRTVARLTLTEVLDQYQVDEDKTATWRPKAWGWIPIPGAGKRTLTVTEGRLLDKLTRQRGLVGLSDFKDIADESFAVSEREYPAPSSVPSYVPTAREREWKGNDGHRDAFRHCYWNARLTKEFGHSWTKQFTTAHEALPGNTAVREAMDLYNNEVGRGIATSNPTATDAQLAKLVKKATDDGRLVVVDRSGNLAWSNTVALWDHGLAGTATRPGAIAVPAGDASVR